jgi:acyl carrier protein
MRLDLGILSISLSLLSQGYPYVNLTTHSLWRFPMSEVKSKVISIIAEQLAKPEESIKETSRFIDDLGADSLDTVEIIMAMEEAFSIEIPDAEQEKIKTVGDAINYIQKNKK